MDWDPQKYLFEMQALVDLAMQLWADGDQEPIYTVSIWTDPNAGASAISIDTKASSAKFIKKVNAFNKKERERLLAEGEAEMAALYGIESRNCSPADFEFRDFAEFRHRWFPPNWEENSDGACWELLLPILRQVASHAGAEFAKLSHEPDAILGINSSRDWFDEEFGFGDGAPVSR